MENIKTSGTYAKQAHVNIPEKLYEEEHGRKGFFGRVSHIYHEHPPVNWTHIEGDLKPRCLPENFHKCTKDDFHVVLKNNDLQINIGQFSQDHLTFFRNADYDELFFIHSGIGKVETTYGHLELKKGDYLIMPRGTTYKIFVQTTLKILKIESRSEFEQPKRGLLGPNALYDQTMIKTPECSQGSETNLDKYVVKVKRLGEITSVTYPFNPLDAKGWKGSVYPIVLSIYDICPVMSHRYHIPPSGHTTFVANNFVICSFVERPLEDKKYGVLKVPFYHSNIDFDEVLFYHQGDFFSRDDIKAGSITFHPQGIHHGPHPKAFSSSANKTHTNEFAVMIDCRNPLEVTPWFSHHEKHDYWKSWMK